MLTSGFTLRLLCKSPVLDPIIYFMFILLKHFTSQVVSCHHWQALTYTCTCFICSKFIYFICTASYKTATVRLYKYNINPHSQVL